MVALGAHCRAEKLVKPYFWFWRLIHLKNKTSFVREWGGYSTLIHPPCYMDLSWLQILLLRSFEFLHPCSQHRLVITNDFMRLCPPSYTLRGSDELNITKTFPFHLNFLFQFLELDRLRDGGEYSSWAGSECKHPIHCKWRHGRWGTANRLGPYVNTHKTAPIGLGPRVNTHHLILELRYILPSLLAIILVIVWSWFWRLIHLRNKTSFVL